MYWGWWFKNKISHRWFVTSEVRIPITVEDESPAEWLHELWNRAQMENENTACYE